MNTNTLSKLFVLICVIFTNLSAVSASKSVIISLKDGSQKSALLSDVAKMTVNDGNITITTNTGGSESAAIADVNKITFGEASGVSSTSGSDKGIAVYPNPCADGLSIKGITQSSQLQFYTIDMKLVKSETVNENATQVDVSELTPGMYIVKIGETAIKIMKK